jgi:hypothetical protein
LFQTQAAIASSAAREVEESREIEESRKIEEYERVSHEFKEAFPELPRLLERARALSQQPPHPLPPAVLYPGQDAGDGVAPAAAS